MTNQHQHHTHPSCPRVLSIAGTDPSGGAGIHADLKSITAAGGYALGVVTGLVAQNTTGVKSIFLPPVSIIEDQLDAVSEDVEIDAVKIGMLSNPDYIESVRTWLEAVKPSIVVLDPVMVATSADRLLEPQAEQALKDMLHLATVITPNTRELEVLADLPNGQITTFEEALQVSKAVAAKYQVNVVVKGGHLHDQKVTNAIVSADGVLAQADSLRSDSTNTHGSGCSMSSALATRLAAGDSEEVALRWCTKWLAESIEQGGALQVGGKSLSDTATTTTTVESHGPLDHSFLLRRLAQAGSTRPWVPDLVDVNELHDPSDAIEPLRKAYESEPFAFYRNSPESFAYLREGVNAQLPPIDENRLNPEGPWTQMCWQAVAPIYQSIQEMPFIQQLSNGTLAPEDFTFFLTQDSWYLAIYGRVLAYLGSMAQDKSERFYWAKSGAVSIDDEYVLYNTWIARCKGTELESITDLPASPVTNGYTDFLQSRAGFNSYAVGVGAVMPCIWFYMDLGVVLADKNYPEHPYNNWLSTYGQPGALEGPRQSIRIFEKALREASPQDRALALKAFMGAALWEYHFFDQAHRYM